MVKIADIDEIMAEMKLANEDEALCFTLSCMSNVSIASVSNVIYRFDDRCKR